MGIRRSCWKTDPYMSSTGHSPGGGAFRAFVHCKNEKSCQDDLKPDSQTGQQLRLLHSIFMTEQSRACLQVSQTLDGNGSTGSLSQAKGAAHPKVAPQALRLLPTLQRNSTNLLVQAIPKPQQVASAVRELTKISEEAAFTNPSP